MTPLVGVLALQGGVREHSTLLTELGAQVRLVRQPRDLGGLDALVLPGGESSVMDRLARLFGLFEPLRTAIADGLPTLGTCAGLVLLAGEVADPAPAQQSLDVLDVTVRRNAFGPQVSSEEVMLPTALGDVRAAFIRAPEITRTGPGVEVLARHQGAVVAVMSGATIGISFHPELTGDPTFHRALLATAAARSGRSSLPGQPSDRILRR